MPTITADSAAAAAAPLAGAALGGAHSPLDVAALAGLATSLFNTLPTGTAAGPSPFAAGGFGAALPSLPLPEIPPLSASLPGEDELRGLIAAALPVASPAGPAVPVAGNDFYFLEHSPQATGGTALPSLAPSAHPPFDVAAVRRDFPILSERVDGRPLVWLDNAATTQKPRSVIERLAYFYEHENSNIHRAAHQLAARATDAYEEAREKVRGFINAGSVDEIVFVRGATEGINLVAQSWGRQNLRAGDEIIVTWLEHHANIVPWHRLCAETGAKLRVVPVDDRGQVLLDEYQRLLNDRTRLVSFTLVSNALGTVTPASQMVELARRAGARVLVDGAQAVSHMAVDVRTLDCDWFVLSGHKVFGPTGIGVLYGKAEVLEATQPWQGGGNMIEDVTFEQIRYHGAPARFEAGTGNIADAVGLGAAIDYVTRIGMANIARHEHDLLTYATLGLSQIPGLRIIGTAAEKAGVLSFVLDGIPAPEVGKRLARDGIAVRSGHHCAQPILRRFGQEATVRPSFALYNSHADIDALVESVRRIRSGTPLL